MSKIIDFQYSKANHKRIETLKDNDSVTFNGDGIFHHPHRLLQLLPVIGQEKVPLWQSFVGEKEALILMRRRKK